MKNTFEGKTFYESAFEPTRGVLVREVEDRPHGRLSYGAGLSEWLSEELPWPERHAFQERWRAKFGHRSLPFSPSPETVDISITDWCAFGCSYCYQDSTAKQAHAPKDLVDKVIHSFDYKPYQVAIGGGEPTAHPDFPEILLNARQAGVVPNYTTAGNVIRPEVIEATNEACGGVAMTYHSWKGLHWFEEHYVKLRKLLKVQLNVHLIADKDVATNLEALTALQRAVGRLNVVMLAYYPDVGRGTLHNIMPKAVYAGSLPLAITSAVASGMTLAFSEGLLPYFLSRPELGVETRFASKAEGLFSAYVDPRGRLSSSSFDPPPKPVNLDATEKFVPEYEEDTPEARQTSAEQELALYPTVWEGRLQDQWDRKRGWDSQPRGATCYSCRLSGSCATPSVHHYFACAFATHNGKQAPLSAEAQQRLNEQKLYEEIAEQEKQLGRQLTPEEYVPYTERFKAIRGL
jgi:organic radical activating enzyme